MSPPSVKNSPLAQSSYQGGTSFGLGTVKGSTSRPKWDSLDTEVQQAQQGALQGREAVFASPQASVSQSRWEKEQDLPPSELKKLEMERAMRGAEEAARARAARTRAQKSQGAASAPWANDFTCDSELY